MSDSEGLSAAGSCWRRHAFRKYPGTITVSIGKAIETAGRKADAVTHDVENWIEAEMVRLRHGQA